MADGPIDCDFPVWGLLPKKETGVVSFLNINGSYDGRDTIIAIFDSGVDPAAAGLKVTSTGETKVIERFDCSGCGDVNTSSVITKVSNGSITGLTGRKLKIPECWKNPSGEWRVGELYPFALYPTKLKERVQEHRREHCWDVGHKPAFAKANKDLQDFDTEKTSNLTPDEKIHKEELEARVEVLQAAEKKFTDLGPAYDCVLYHDGHVWRACIDTSECGDLKAGPHLGEYSATHEHAHLTPLDEMTISINVHDGGDVLEVVGMCSTHGTHVAAIASGYFPAEPDRNGVAPGAKLISLTVGDSRLGSMETGTALVRACIKVMELSKKMKIDIINMSYGEHAHWSNAGRIGELIGTVVNRYGISWVVSAGNHGPALCTIGAPPDISQSVLIGVGAYVSPEMMSAAYSMRTKGAGGAFSWSSRGPCTDGAMGVTVCAPGGAVASVARFTLRNSQLMNGTSMAAPHVAGAVALLINGLKKKGLPYSPYSLKRALENSATYLQVEPWAQGCGLLNVEKAFEILTGHSDAPERDVTFNIQCGSSHSKGVLLRPRVGEPPRDVGITIEPQFLQNHEDVDGKEKQLVKWTSDQKQILQAINNIVKHLHAIEKITSESDVDEIKTGFKKLLKYLPGPVTVQKLCKLEEPVLNSELVDAYTSLLSCVLNILLPCWQHFQDVCVTLFLLDESFELIQETLTLLCGYFKNETNNKSLEALGSILLKFVKSDCMLTSFIDCSNVQFADKSQLYKRQDEWENFVQLLVTLPERIANKLEKNTPKEFSHEKYSFILMFHIIRNIDFMTDSSFHNGVKYDMSYLSHILSKFITNYNMGGNSEALTKFVDILIAWTANENTDQTKFIRKKLIQKLLLHLSRQAIETLSVLLLTKCAINPKNKEQSILEILGDNIDGSKDWNQVFCFKLPFQTRPKDYKNTTFCENLVYYLSSSRKSAEILSDFSLRVSNVWSDIKALNTSNGDQHVLLSQMLILSVKYRIMIHKQQDIKWETQALKNILFRGMSKHLDSLSLEVRTIGMATIEIILNNLQSIENNTNDTQLKFDYTKIDQKYQEILKTLHNIDYKCLLDPNLKYCTTSNGKSVNIQELLDFFAFKLKDKNEEDYICNTLVTSAIKTQDQTKVLVKTITADKFKTLAEKAQDEDDLDSDDDLQPYDMRNDVESAAKKKPAYLRDLIEKIIEGNDFEEFEQCLLISEDLVVNQLKNEDASLALELLNVFINLECKFNIDDFDNIRFNTCVAVVCCQPRVCAEHLCNEFHADVGRYSIATKILMLDVLSEAANRLADLQIKSDPKIVKQKEILLVEVQKEDITAEEMIRRRLINKTRYFHSKRQHPFAKATKNQFAVVSDSFFYPLVYGFGKKQLNLSYHNMKQDTDNFLLLKYISVVGNIILVSKNCPNCLNYCTEIIEILLYLRYNSEPKILIGVMSLIASIVLALPEFLLKTDLFDSMMVLRSWLIDCLSNVDLTLRLGGPKSEAAIFAGQTLHLLEKALGDDK